MKNGYNYVLTLTDSSQGKNAMQVPLKYPKSTVHHVSSDEDEPEDLSRIQSTVKHKPENLSVSRNGLPNKGSNDVKYDRNANAVPLSQLQNNQFVAQTQIPIPHNLLFHDPRSVTHVGPPPMLQMKPMPSTVEQNAPHFGQGIQTSVTQSVIMHGHTLLMAQHNVPQSPTGAPLLLRSGLMSPNSSTQILVPIAPLISPSSGGGHPQPNTPNLSSSEDTQTQDSPETARKKRKKMEDTTVFRDPPEQSLPFNGPNKYRFYCDVCDTGFTRRYTFNRHKCKGRVEKHYCQLCDKAYLSKYKLKDHILVKHEGQTVSCPECGKRFSSRSSMEMHKKQQHEGQYSIFCKICGKGFNHTGHYYGHMNKHTNTKPFWCQQCGKRFYGSSYLHNHKQVCRGNNDMNFACSVCDRKFKCELYLKKHMKIHDNTPIISNPDVVKASDEDLANAGVNLAEMDDSQSLDSINGEKFGFGQPIFPNGPDQSDSNSSFMDDAEPLVKEGNNNNESQQVVAT
ncbi:hypothetical protein DPMN_015587 [Dreissena polymorpha]|uniref:C2H2-type domain-containing protein n=2 Tax=Dreissena polymorpha TaxID=45954 RepID=A0A9D4N816_DREPO|nr:hypothetical protein DPMN_015587 [Dreissena polymorpha]